MFEITTRPAALPTFVLTDGEAGSRAEVVPGRGGFLSRFRVAGIPVIEYDEAGTYDRALSVRGGMPLLFPLAGKLRDDSYTLDGRTYPMTRHGFARQMEWKVVRQETGDAARLSLELTSSEATRAVYPFDFQLVFTYEVRGFSVALHQEIRNLSSRPMPFQSGVHPYLYVPDAEKPAARITTCATRAFDNVAGREVPFAGFDLAAKELDLHLLDHGRCDASLTRPSLNGSIVVSASHEFSRWVVWTKAGGDTVCVEPWTAPASAWEGGPGLLWIAPSESRSLTVRIELCPAG